MSYYQQIDGIKYDRALIEAATAAVSGKGDGRVSQADAEALLALVTDGGRYTDVEKATIAHLRSTLNWTDKATAWFDKAIADWESGDAPAASQAAPQASQAKPPAIIIRIGAAFKTAKYFPADAAAEAQHSAVVLLRKADGGVFGQLFADVEAHKSGNLSDEVEHILGRCSSDFIRARAWKMGRIFGVQGGMIYSHWGFTNVPTQVLIDALVAMNFDVIEGDSV